MAMQFIGNDVAPVYKALVGREVERTLYWGDAVEVTNAAGARIEIAWRDKPGDPPSARFLGKQVKLVDQSAVMKVRFIDVGQGDGAIVESPTGKRVLIDGGQFGHLLNYVKRAFPQPCAFEAVVVSHGDADHFEGVTKLLNDPNRVTVERVWHNGLAKRPSKKPDHSARNQEEMFGATASAGGELFCTELVDDLSSVADAELNGPFQEWKAALAKTKNSAGGKPVQKRLSRGDPLEPLKADGITFEVLGPIAESVNGKPALRMLHAAPGASAFSASHTVNGHSVVLRMTYGNVRMLFAADLNEESEALLLSAQADLEAEVLKVPHHGSHDFSDAMLKAVSPVISVISSGDESEQLDHIHPRAVLVGALGRASTRVDRPVVLVTEMVAFFENLDEAEKAKAAAAGLANAQRLVRKREYGIVHVRTDGKRLVVITRGAAAGDTEPYAFRVDASHKVTPVAVSKP